MDLNEQAVVRNIGVTDLNVRVFVGPEVFETLKIPAQGSRTVSKLYLAAFKNIATAEIDDSPDAVLNAMRSELDAAEGKATEPAKPAPAAEKAGKR